MRHHGFFLAALGLAGVSFSAAAQQTVSHGYRGVVTHVAGEQSDAVQVGEAVSISYTVDAAASDVASDPQAGVFPTGLVSLTLQLPDSGLAVSTGAGKVQTFDNTSNPDDQVSFFSSNIASPDDLQGLPVSALELGFIGSTDMLASDALPTQRIDAGQNAVLIATDRGWTSFLFTVTTEPTVAELVEDGVSQLQAGLLAGAVTNGGGTALATQLHHLQAAFEAAQARRSCASLTAFSAQLGAMARSGQISAALAAELRALAQELELALGGC